jgi:hypothetical protein
MTEKTSPLPAGLPSPDGVERENDMASEPGSTKRRDVVPALYLLGFVVLAAAIIWLWQNPPIVTPPPPSPDVELLRQQMDALQLRLARLEQRPTPIVSAPPDLAPLAARVAALEARKPAAPVDLGPIESAIAELEKRPAGDPALAARMDALAGRQDNLTGRVDAAGATLAHRQDAIDARIAPLEKDSGQITALADRAARIARIQAAQTALESGLKLGELTGAPAALARYAANPPPTEASLRLSFPAAAGTALDASRPTVSDKPFLARAWARAQDLITLREGDHVIFGDPAAGIIARARASLDAGDLAGAVAALGALVGAPAAAVAGWKAQAQSLLDARKALADMAAHA